MDVRSIVASAFVLALTASSFAGADNSRYGILDSAGNFIVVDRCTASGTDRIRTVKRTSSGSLVWSKDYTNSSFPSYYRFCRVRADASNNIFVAGYVQNSSTNTTGKFFLLKYNSGGSVAWTREYSTGLLANANVTDLGVDTNGAAYLVANNIDASGNSTGKLLKYTSSGTLSLDVNVLPAGMERSYLSSIEISGTNRLFLAGTTEDDVAPGTVDRYTYMSRYSTSLALSWESTERIHASNDYYPTQQTDIALDASGRPVASYGYINFSANAYSTYVRKKGAGGATLWNSDLTTVNTTCEAGLIVDAADDVVFGGLRRVLAGTGTPSGWQMVKLDGGTGATDFSDYYPLPTGGSGGTMETFNLAEDAGGGYLITGDYIRSDGVREIRVPYFTAAGSPTGYYYFNPTSNNRCFSVVTTTTGGTFYVGGDVGDGTGYYPYQAKVTGFGTLAWAWYTTTTYP